MNKAELISKVAANTESSQASAKNLVDMFMGIFTDTLLAGEEVTLPGIGKLKISVRPGRPGRNPATGAAITIPEKRVVKFAPASSFKADLAE